MKTIYEASKAANEAPPESMFSCLMRVMQRGDIGLKAIACCADAIAADARFNIRMAEVEKKSATHERLMDIIEEYERLATECQRNVADFEAQGGVDMLRQSLRVFAKGLEASLEG